MAEQTGISWATSTFNPWIGCTKVSPGCDHCYAEELATRRLGVAWGPHAARRRTAPGNWRQPLRWNRQAAESGRPWRVFCSSLADVFDNRAPEGAREDLWALIRATPALTWMLLTKRPQNIAAMLPADWGGGYRNVWLGTSAENQEEADRRIPHLAAIPAELRFLSCEPLLGLVDVARWLRVSIDWVIVGGESGSCARPMDPAWALDMRDQCVGAERLPFHFKQWGGWAPKAGGRLLDGREYLAIPGEVP